MTVQPNAMIVNEKDHVVMVVNPVKAGETVCWKDSKGLHAIAAQEDIPKYHKVAVRSAAKGEQVLKYGENIGRALEDIAVGAWVHTHNISDFPEEA